MAATNRPYGRRNYLPHGFSPRGGHFRHTRQRPHSEPQPKQRILARRDNTTAGMRIATIHQAYLLLSLAGHHLLNKTLAVIRVFPTRTCTRQHQAHRTTGNRGTAPQLVHTSRRRTTLLSPQSPVSLVSSLDESMWSLAAQEPTRCFRMSTSTPGRTFNLEFSCGKMDPRQSW